MCGMLHKQAVALGCHCGSCICVLQAGWNTEWLEHKGILGFCSFKGLWVLWFFQVSDLALRICYLMECST